MTKAWGPNEENIFRTLRTIDQEDVILVHIDDVVSSAHCSTVAIASVIVTTVELVHDQCCSITAQVLDLCKLRILHNLAGWVARVGGQDDRSTTRNLFGNLFWMDMVAICFGQRRGNSSKVSEESQHLIISSIVRNEETQISIIQDSSDTDETSSAARDDSNILPGILAVFALTMMYVVQIGDGSSQWLDTCSWTILSASHRHINSLGAFKAALDIIVDFRSTLAEIGPLCRVILEAMLGGSLGTPNHARTGTAGVEAGMGSMSFMSIAKLAVDLGIQFATSRPVNNGQSRMMGGWMDG